MSDIQTVHNNPYENKSLEHLMACMIRSAAAPIILVNRQGYILFLNDAYERWCGLTREQIIGLHITEVVPNTRTHIVAATGKEELQHVQKCFGKIVLSNRYPIFDNNHELLGAWGIVDVSDISAISGLQVRINNLNSELASAKDELHSYQSTIYTFDDIIGTSAPIVSAKRESSLAASLSMDVLLQGAPGTGKELFAHAIHSASSRCSGPFISVNCSCLPLDKINEILWGSERWYGSYIGKAEAANGGTLFLDEIGDLPVEAQRQILHLIEKRRPIHESDRSSRPLSLQIIASTNRNLKEMVDNGAFYADLYYALISFSVTIPSLRERQEDIPALADYFAERYSRLYQKTKKSFSPAALKYLTQRNWGGNVRELSNFIKNIVIRTPEAALAYTITSELEKCPSKSASPSTIESMEEQLILSALKDAKGNIRKAAECLGLNRNTLYRKLKKYDIAYAQFRSTKSGSSL